MGRTRVLSGTGPFMKAADLHVWIISSSLLMVINSGFDCVYIRLEDSTSATDGREFGEVYLPALQGL